ncbi:hydroxyisourate hydrolase [Actinacidiphila acididurans]|uniref:5-hydroxyisourate hydrolase n=1 Tax=Actinacidiphila acididurans TaxID=2784346 RepID=A0ABS2TUH8_9ACTN|nr:hydroxyisourate hydrolase [Actinacidiphila acididurans]MBM9506985.1 hydroxyisourate hydrolase [Actinacidiphila acididurans]
MTSTSEAAPGTATVSTHVLDTAAGRPGTGVPVEVSVRPGPQDPWTPHARSVTDADGRCAGLPALPPGTAHVMLSFDVQGWRAGSAAPGTAAPGPYGTGPAFFPEVTVVFAVRPGEHHHVPLLLSPFGYSVYRGS